MVNNLSRMIIVMAPGFVVLFGLNSSTEIVMPGLLYGAFGVTFAPILLFLLLLILSMIMESFCGKDPEFSMGGSMTKKIGNMNRLSSRSWGPLTSPNPPTGWWPPAWDEYVRSGDWGAVIVSNGSIYQVADLESHLKAVLPLHVEESKNLSVLPRERLGDSFDNIMKGKVSAAVDWLNAEGEGWPHDEAFFKEPKEGFYWRIRRIHGRRNGSTSGDTSLRSSFESVA